MSTLSNPPPTKDTSLPASPTSTVSPFASPNAIPPRTSSHGLVNPNTAAQRSRVSVLRPLSEIDWMSQSSSLSAKSKRNSNSAVPLVQQLQQQQQQQQSPPTSPTTSTNMVSQQSQANSQPTPMSYAPQPSQSQSQAQPSHASPPPPPPAQDNFHDKLIYGSQTAWTEEKERILLGPYDYLVGHPGKDVRSQFIAAFNEWLRVPEDRLEVITRVVGMLHTASLLVDDVEDSSVLRRGIPVANSIFGTAQTINSANYVYFKALADVVSLGNPKLIDIFTEELINLHRGQGMELYWRDSLTCPSEEDYLEMVGNKTGGLFRLAIKLMQAESSVDIDCTPLVSTVGVLFQILDDHLNLSPTSGYASLKGLCEDLTEGKFSFPVIHAIRADPGNHVLTNILKQKTNDEEVKRYAIRYMEERGSFEYSRRVIQRLRERSDELVAEVEGRLRELGVDAAEGGAALRKVLERLVLR